MKKILVAMSSLYSGGAERSLVNMLTELPPDKYEIDLLLLKKVGMFLTQVPVYINILETPMDIKRLYSPLLQTGIVFPIVVLGNIISRIFTKNSRECRGFRWKYFYGPMIKTIEKHYDVAIAYISGEILYLVDEKISADRKIVWIHNDYRSALHPKKYDYMHLKNMDVIVSVSNACVQIFNEEFPEFSDKTCMLENITSSTIVRNRANEFIPSEYQTDRLKILSIGRLHEQKGFDIAIDAAAKLKNARINFLWIVIGTGDLQEQLQMQIVSNDLQEQFKLLGARENPYCYIKNCDIFVQSSRYEGKSVVLDEAKILAKPIVVTNYPTVQDQIENGREGIIVPVTPEGIANGIERMLIDDLLRRNIQTYLNKHEYGNQEVVKKYMEIIDKE